MYPSNVGTASAPSDSPSSIGTPSEPYTITFTVSGGISLNIASPMPERFSLAMSANWDAPFARSSANAAAGIVNAATKGKVNIDGASIQSGLSALGMPSRTKVESMQVWQDSSPFAISLPLVLYAIDDPASEIQDKVKKLLMLCAPTETGGLLSPPGPYATVNSSTEGGTNVTVQIGQILRMERCLVKSVNADIEAIIHKSGYPMTANVNVEVESHFASFTTNDISRIFL